MATGFSLIELLVSLAVLAIIMVIGIPALLNSLHHAKLEGIVRQAATLAQRARLEAIKRNRTTMLFADTAKQEISAFVDTNGNRVQDLGEDTLGLLPLPNLVELKGATRGGANDALAIEGFGGDLGPVFQPDGSVLAEGAIRLADERNNALEIRVVSQATGRMEVRKWLDDSMDVSSNPLRDSGPTGTGPGWYAKGEAGRGWVWN